MSSDEEMDWEDFTDYLIVYEDDTSSEDSEAESLFDLSDSQDSVCHHDSWGSGQTGQQRSIPDGNVKAGPAVHNPMQESKEGEEENQLASPAREPLLYEGSPRGSGSCNLPQRLDREVGDGSATGQAGGGGVQSGSQRRHQEPLRATQSYMPTPPDRDCPASACVSLGPGTRKRKPHYTLDEVEYWSPEKRRRTYEARMRLSRWVNPLLHSLAQQNDAPQSIDAVKHVSAQGADQERGGDVQPGSQCPHQEPLRATQSSSQIRSPPGKDCPASACASPGPNARKWNLDLALDEEGCWSSAKRRPTSAPSVGLSEWVNPLLPSPAQQNDAPQSIDAVKHVSAQGADQERGGDVQLGSQCPHQEPVRATQSSSQIRSPPGKEGPASACTSPGPGARKRNLDLSLDEEEWWSSAKCRPTSAPNVGLSEWVNPLLPSPAQQNDASENIDALRDVSVQGAGQCGHLVSAKTRRAIRFDPYKEGPTLTLDPSQYLPAQHVPATRRIHYNAANTTRCGANIQRRDSVRTSHAGVRGTPTVVKIYCNGPPSSAAKCRRR